MTTLGQTATLALVESAAVGADVTALASFTPIRRGRPVSFQRLEGGTTWVTEATATQNRNGKAAFVVDTSTPGTTTYRAVTARWRGAAAKATSAAQFTVTDVDPGDTTPPGPVSTVTVTGATASSLTLTWVNPGDADFAGVMIRRAVGSTPPATPASGTLVVNKDAPATSHTDTGLNASTQYSYALFARDEVPNYATGATGSGTTTAATTSDWTQARHTPEHRNWSPTESTISAGNVASLGEEWTVPGGGTPVISGTTLYVIAPDELTGEGALTAYDLVTGNVLWSKGTGTCTAGPLSLTSTLVVVGCGSQPRAYARGGSPDLSWDTADNDPGQSLQEHLQLGSTVIAWSQDRVTAYRDSDGARLWQQLLPSGATAVQDVAASGGTVVVVYDDRLRALSATNGSQLWSAAGVTSSQLVVADGWVYTNDEQGVSRYQLSNGAAGWSVRANTNIYSILAADADTVYVWEAVFDFGPPNPSIVRALNVSDGSQRWEYYVPSRVQIAAVTGGLVWVTSSDIVTQDLDSDLIALDRQLRAIDFDDNIYGFYQNIAFGAGKVVLDQGGSGGVGRQLRVFGIAGPRPAITSAVLPVGRVGTPYSHQLTSNVPSGLTWTVDSGSLPNGITLSAAGVLSGTPTTPVKARVTLRVTGSNGRASTRPFTVLVEPATTTATWLHMGRDASRNPYEPGSGELQLEDAPTFSYRWTTAAPGTAVSGGDLDVGMIGDTLYTVMWDGLLKAFSTTGTTTNRPPLWTASAETGSTFYGAPAVAGDRIVLKDNGGYLYALNATTGARVWRTDESVTTTANQPLVVGSSVFVRDNAYRLRAFALSDGTPLWGGAIVDLGFDTDFSSDGTRLFAVADCTLYAITASSGAIAWQRPLRSSGPSCNTLSAEQAPPIVVGGKVHAGEPASKAVVDAVTGALLLDFATSGFYGGDGVVVGDVWVFESDGRLVAVDTVTGRLLWKSAPGLQGAELSATDDLIFVAGFDITAISRLTGERVWDGGAVSGFNTNGSPALRGNRVFLPTQTGVRAYGPL